MLMDYQKAIGKIFLMNATIGPQCLRKKTINNIFFKTKIIKFKKRI